MSEEDFNTLGLGLKVFCKDPTDALLVCCW